MLRLIGAVVAGYVVFAVLSVALFVLTGRDAHATAPVGFLAGATVYGMIAALLAGFTATRISGRAELRPAVAVAVLIGIGAVVSMIGTPAAASRWSQWAALLLMAPMAVLGGMLALRGRAATGRARPDRAS